jgi:2-aminoadipate transaminase
VLITAGSRQGLDLIGKVLVDPGSRVAVESPTCLGPLQAFAPYEPDFIAVDGDDEGPSPAALDAARGWARRPFTSAPSARCWCRACDQATYWRPGCCTLST